jgi:hypothetical protein
VQRRATDSDSARLRLKPGNGAALVRFRVRPKCQTMCRGERCHPGNIALKRIDIEHETGRRRARHRRDLTGFAPTRNGRVNRASANRCAAPPRPIRI